MHGCLVQLPHFFHELRHLFHELPHFFLAASELAWAAPAAFQVHHSGRAYHERINRSRYATLSRSSCTSSMSCATWSLSSLTSSWPRLSWPGLFPLPSPAPAAPSAAASLSAAHSLHLCCLCGRNLSDLALFCQQPGPWAAQVKQPLQPSHWQYGVGSIPETDDSLVPVQSKMLERK